MHIHIHYVHETETSIKLITDTLHESKLAEMIIRLIIE